MEVVLAADSGRLTLKQGREDPEPLTFVGDDTWQNGSTVLKFERTNGKPSRLRFDAGYLYVQLTRKATS